MGLKGASDYLQRYWAESLPAEGAGGRLAINLLTI